MTENALASAQQLVQAVVRAVPDTKKGSVELIRDLASNVQALRGGDGGHDREAVEPGGQVE